MTKSFDTKKKYIINGVKKLPHTDVVDIGKLIARLGHGDMLKYNSDGCRLDLDKLCEKDESAIDTIYNQVYHKINK